MAAGIVSVSVADSHRMDRAVKKQRKSSRNAEDRSFQMRRRIEAAIRSIPRGKVSTYGAIARAAGIPRGARLVARVLKNDWAIGLPWQRVLGAGGEIKLRGDSAMEQRFRLESEGVRFRGRKVDMKEFEFRFGRVTRH